MANAAQAGWTAGQIYQFEVVEILSSQDILVSFNGEVFRVKNMSKINLKAGQKIQLQVKYLQPLEFQIAEGFTGQGPLNRINRFI